MPGYPVQIANRQSRLADPGRDSQSGRRLTAHHPLEREPLRATSWRCNHQSSSRAIQLFASCQDATAVMSLYPSILGWTMHRSAAVRVGPFGALLRIVNNVYQVRIAPKELIGSLQW